METPSDSRAPEGIEGSGRFRILAAGPTDLNRSEIEQEWTEESEDGDESDSEFSEPIQKALLCFDLNVSETP